MVGSLMLVVILGTALQGALPASAAPPPTLQTLSGEQSPVPLGDTLLGPATPSTTMSLEVTLQPRDPIALAAEVKAVSTPGSPEYHQFITPAEFAQLYGPTPATIAQVTSALQAEGLTVGAVSGTDLYLPITATVAQTEAAFATPILSFQLSSGSNGFYNTAAPSVPASVASEIQGILGLDTLNVAQPVGPLAPHVKSSKVTSHDVGPALAPGQPTPTGASCIAEIGRWRVTMGR